MIEEFKLLFFTVPKNSCTEWKRLFWRMMKHPQWKSYGMEAHDPSKNGLQFLDHYPLKKQKDMMMSPEWSKAIFVREPLERLLSAFIEKGLYNWFVLNK